MITKQSLEEIKKTIENKKGIECVFKNNKIFKKLTQQTEQESIFLEFAKNKYSCCKKCKKFSICSNIIYLDCELYMSTECKEIEEKFSK